VNKFTPKYLYQIGSRSSFGLDAGPWTVKLFTDVIAAVSQKARVFLTAIPLQFYLKMCRQG
jgi:hypothetical protein